MFRSARAVAALSSGALFLSGTAGCGARKTRAFEPDDMPSTAVESAPSAEAQPPRDRPTVIVGRTILYPVQWGRAEDLALTMGPVLESIYGPGTTVVPYPLTNHLIIHLPPGASVPLESNGNPAPGGGEARTQ